MSERVFKVVGLIAVTLVGVLGCGALIHLVMTIPVPPGESAANLISAGGSLGALFLTIFIATAETRRRNRADRDRATLAAAKLVERIVDWKGVMWCVNRNLLNAQSDYYGLCHDEADQIRQLKGWSEDEILPLITLPDHIAIRMQRITERTGRLQRRLEHVSRIPGNPSAEAIAGMNETLLKDVRQNEADLAICVRHLENLLGDVYGKP